MIKSPCRGCEHIHENKNYRQHKQAPCISSCEKLKEIQAFAVLRQQKSIGDVGFSVDKNFDFENQVKRHSSRI